MPSTSRPPHPRRPGQVPPARSSASPRVTSWSCSTRRCSPSPCPICTATCTRPAPHCLGRSTRTRWSSRGSCSPPAPSPTGSAPAACTEPRSPASWSSRCCARRHRPSVCSSLGGHRPGTAGKPIDGAGLVLSVIALGALSFGLIDGGTGGWARPGPVVALALAACAVVALVAVERRAPGPVLPPALLRLPRVRADLVAGAVASMVFYGVFFALTLWLQDTRHLGPVQAGAAFLPMTLPMCVLPLVAGRLVARIGARPVILVGLAADVVSGVLLAFAGSHSLGWVLGAQVFLVLGSTLAIPAATADMASAAPPQLAATGQGAFNAGRLRARRSPAWYRCRPAHGRRHPRCLRGGLGRPRDTRAAAPCIGRCLSRRGGTTRLCGSQRPAVRYLPGPLARR